MSALFRDPAPGRGSYENPWHFKPMLCGSSSRMGLGLPAWMTDCVLARPTWRRLGRMTTHPVSAMVIYSVVIGVWHVPTFYDLALRNKVVHVFEHVSFFLAAVIYWWPLLTRSKEVPKSGYGAQMLYILAVQIAMTPVFAYVTFSTDILYPTYEFAPRLIASLPPADDQLLAGAMMKIGGMLVSLVIFIIVFYRWYRAGEKEPSLAKRIARPVVPQESVR